MPEARDHQERHRVLTIRGRGPCNNRCSFCVEQYSTTHPAAPPFDDIVGQLAAGVGQYNMLSLAAGEPTLHKQFFEILEHARRLGYEHVAISSNFRRFAYASFARRTLEAGVRYFDLSLHGYNRASQARINPIGDDGASFDQALAGLANLFAVARRLQLRIEVTHKIVACEVNLAHLSEVMGTTRVLGVRNYIVQPVRIDDFPPDVAARFSLDARDCVPHLNRLIETADRHGIKLKLFGFSLRGIELRPSVATEQNHVTNRFPGEPDFVQRPSTSSEARAPHATPDPGRK